MSKYKEFVTHSRAEKYDSYSTKKIEEFDEVIADGKLADHAFITKVMGHLLGKTLTIVDASAFSGQKKAVKDLLRDAYSQEMEFVAGMMYDQEKLNEIANAEVEAMDELPEPVSIEQALGTR